LTIPVFNRPEYADAALAGQAICRSHRLHHRNPGLWGGAMKHVQISEQIDVINLIALRHDVQRAVAMAKIVEFENQAHRLGDVLRTGLLGRAASDLLIDVATANGLVREHGDDLIQSIISEGLR
jgi:hypothetical protein